MGQDKIARSVRIATPVTFGERLRDAFNGAKNVEIAKQLGVSEAAVRNYLDGRIPSAELLVLISNRTKCSIHWLITGRGSKWVNDSTDLGEESPIYFGEKEQEIIQDLALQKGRAFDEEVRELVLDRLKALGLVTDQVQGVDLVFFGREVPTLKPMRLWGEIAAGVPIDVFEETETVLVPEEFFTRGRENFALRVRGDSMEDDGIFEGDIIICYESPTANNGDTVVALIDGSQATVKKFYKERDQIRLQPKSSKHQPIYLSHDRITIQGIVTGIFRRTV